MRDRRSAVPHGTRGKQGEALKDEVYRRMFRLEAGHPGADGDLAIALLRAYAACEAASGIGVERSWLKKVCPICLAMIEAARHAEETEQRRAQ